MVLVLTEKLFSPKFSPLNLAINKFCERESTAHTVLRFTRGLDHASLGFPKQSYNLIFDQIHF